MEKPLETIAGLDSVLASAISDGKADSVSGLDDPEIGRKLLQRIAYHGVNGLLLARPDVCNRWPEPIVAEVREFATGQAMWELQHRTMLVRLLDAFASHGVTAILLKGTAIAYDLYEEPATRCRGDTDILVERADLPLARSILEDLGFELPLAGGALPDELRLQEIWTVRTSNGHDHAIDLHWSVLNSPTLANLFTEAECKAAARPLPRLCESARALDRPRMLLHACVHRELHVSAPYFVEDRTYYGGDRLIWLRDIVLLVNSLSEQEWGEFLGLAEAKGVSKICTDAIALAFDRHGSSPPEHSAPRGKPTRASSYLKASQSKRALMDLLSVPGLRRKLAYLFAQALPSEALIRAKYPRMKHLPVQLLHARRFIELILPRPRGRH